MRIMINGTEYAALHDFTITEQSGNKSSSEISVEVPRGQPVPEAGDIVEIRRGNTPVFFGTCGIPRSPQYSTGLERPIYTITCGGANNILARRIVNEAYENHTVSEIVAALYNGYIAEEGISLGSVSTVPDTVKIYTAKDHNLQDALNELADLVGATWKISPDRKFHFIAEDDFPAFPCVIDTEHLLGGCYQHTTKDAKRRTVQYISGATDTTSEQTETYVYSGSETSFPLVYPVAARPSIRINDVPVDPSHIGVTGLNSLDADCWFLFSYNSASVSYNAASGALSSGDTVKFCYTGLYPIRIVLQNTDKIARIADKTGLSGKMETVEQASGIRSYDDAIALAQSLLSQFSESTGEVRVTLTSDQLATLGCGLSDTEILTRVTVNLPQIRITGDYVIVERTVSPLSPLSPDGGSFKIQLRMADRDYLQSYGETISEIRRSTHQLAIREDDVVIKTRESGETEAVSESLEYHVSNVYYPSASGALFTLFSPCDLGNPVYPV